jgi:hypothetical protein
MRGVQEATTTRFSPSSRMSSWIISWPGSEHMYLYCRATVTPGSVAAISVTASVSTVAEMLTPQSQM